MKKTIRPTPENIQALNAITAMCLIYKKSLGDMDLPQNIDDWMKFETSPFFFYKLTNSFSVEHVGLAMTLIEFATSQQKKDYRDVEMMWFSITAKNELNVEAYYKK